MTEVPKGWAIASLAEICQINPRVDKKAFEPDDVVAFVPMPAVEAETGRIDVSETRTFNEVKQGYTPFMKGDVLFAKITPCMENGKMAIVPEMVSKHGFGSTEFHVLRPLDGIASEYIYHAVSNLGFRYHAEHNMTGAVGQKRVPASVLEDHAIGVPPTNEQRRIVERIEAMWGEIDHGVENLKKARATLGLYRQSLLKSAFEGRLTADWRARNGIAASNRQLIDLGEHIDFLTSGSRGWAKYYSDQGDTFIRAQNLKYDRLELDDIAYVKLPEGSSEGMRTRVHIGDVLITITGANVTKTALVENELGTAYVSQHVALCRLSDELSPRYVWHFLLSKSGGRKQLEEAAYGAGKPGLNLTNIREVKIPICSPEEQVEITRILDERLSAADALETEIDAGLIRAEALRQSILKQAFSGKLVPQDPEDEPAATLLARIKAEKATKPKAPRKRKATA